MSATKTDVEQVRHVIQAYIDGSERGDVKLLRSIFHPNALMSGYIKGELGIGSPEPFFEAVVNAPNVQGDEPYSANIANIEVAGFIASATIVEKQMLGMNFVDYFHLIKEDDKWSIVSKTYCDGQP